MMPEDHQDWDSDPTSLSDILVGIGVAFAIFAVVVAEVGLWSVERGNAKSEASLSQMRQEVRSVAVARSRR